MVTTPGLSKRPPLAPSLTEAVPQNPRIPCWKTNNMYRRSSSHAEDPLLREPLLLEFEEDGSLSSEGASTHRRGGATAETLAVATATESAGRRHEEEDEGTSSIASSSRGRSRQLMWTVAALVALTISFTVSILGRGGDASGPRSSSPYGFPSPRHAAELAYLSELVYRFKNVDDDGQVCDEINADNNDDDLKWVKSNEPHPNYFPLKCHWYHHDRIQGTQVMLVRTREYWAVVFAGTDDLKTSLTDVNIFEVHPSFPHFNETPFYDSRIRVHAGFDRAVFSGIYANLTRHLTRHLGAEQEVTQQHRWSWRRWFNRRHSDRASRILYTTGHSLGAANAVLTALALGASSSSSFLQPGTAVASINFGCPRLGNRYFRDFADRLAGTGSNNASFSSTAGSSAVPIWRVVLGWDLVPRLPEFLLHVGHTIQLTRLPTNGTAPSPRRNASSTSDDDGGSGASSNPAAYRSDAYYLHYGDPEQRYAGVPFGWSATPFLWVPGALGSHSVHRYVKALRRITAAASPTTPHNDRDDDPVWIRNFVPTPPPFDDQNHSRRHSDSDALWDDDTWADPPVAEGGATASDAAGFEFEFFAGGDAAEQELAAQERPFAVAEEER